METSEKLKELLTPVLEGCNVRLYELKWLSNEHTLQVSIMKEDGTMDLDTCAEVSEKIGEVLDKEDPIQSDYMLEVCSPGAEREIKDLDELNNMVGSYVFVRLKEPFKNMNELEGEIVSIVDGVVKLSYRDKAAKRNAEFTKENISYIRMAVRI